MCLNDSIMCLCSLYDISNDGKDIMPFVGHTVYTEEYNSKIKNPETICHSPKLILNIYNKLAWF